MTIGRLILKASLAVLICANLAIGAVAWQSTHVLDEGNIDEAIDVQVANDGNIFVSGNSVIGSRQRALVAIYGPSLGSPTVNYYPAGNPPTSQFFIENCMVLSPISDVALCGNGTVTGFSLSMGLSSVFDSDAGFIWSSGYDGNQSAKSVIAATYDSNGDLFTGIAQNSMVSSMNGYVRLHDGATGGQVWIYAKTAGGQVRYFFRAAAADNVGNVYFALEIQRLVNNEWQYRVQVLKFSSASSTPSATSSEIKLNDEINVISDIVYVPCSSGVCSGDSKLILVTQDGLIAFNSSNLSVASSYICQGYSKAAAFASTQFAVVGPRGVGRFNISNLATPVWECTSVSTYVDVATTASEGIVCVDTYDNDVRVTHFPNDATGCNDSESAYHDGGSSAVDEVVAVAAKIGTGCGVSDVYVAATSSNDYVTMLFTASSSLGECSANGTPYSAGDADGNCFVSISDPVYLINYVFGGGPAPSPMEAGDADGNGIVTISDAVRLINYIFSGGLAPVCGG